MKTSTIPTNIAAQHQSYLESFNQHFTENNFDSAESAVVKSLELINKHYDQHWEDAIISYQALRKIYNARDDKVNESAITNFIKAIYKQHQGSALEESPDQKRIREIRELAAQELAQCNVPRQAPYPNGKAVAANRKIPTNSVEAVYKSTSIRLRNFVKDLIDDLTQDPEIGPVPNNAKHAVICFGSLARNEATPYSDLEFGILLDEKAAQDEEVKKYFRNLTKELNIRIINLGETTIRIQNIESIQHLTSPTSNGFSFDGADVSGCKTPLGNTRHIQKNLAKINPENETEIAAIKAGEFELIATPKEMAQFHDEEWYKQDSHISTALMSSRFVTGNAPELEQEYQNAMNEVLDRKITNTENTTIRQQRANNLLRQSIGRFEIKAGKTDQTNQRSFSPKYDFYRPPVMLIDHLALLHKVEGNSAWERLEGLFTPNQQNVFGWIFGQENKSKPLAINDKSGVENLRWMLDRTMQIRLQNYLANGTQKEDMELLDDKMSDSKKTQLIESGLGISMSDMMEVYYVMTPFQNKIKQFIRKENLDSTLSFNDKYHSSGNETKGHIHHLLLNYPAAIKCYEQEIDNLKAKPSSQDNDIHQANCLNNLAISYSYVGNYKRAQTLYNQSLGIKRSRFGPDHPSTLTSLGNSANTCFSSGEYEEAVRITNQALKIAEREFGPNSPNCADYLGNLGAILEKQGKNDQALIAHDKSLEIRRKIFGENNGDVAESLSNVGIIQTRLGNYPEAIKCLKKSVAIQKSIFGNNHPNVAAAIHGLATVYSDCGQYEEAIELFEQDLKIVTSSFGENHPNAATVLNGLGLAHERNGDYDISLNYQERALTIMEKTFGINHPDTVTMLNDIANIHNIRGDHDKAIAIYNRAFETSVARFGSHPNEAMNLNNLGLSCFRQGKLDEAMGHLEKSLKMKKEAFGEDHPIIASTLVNIANIHMARGDMIQAIDLYNQSLAIIEKKIGKEHPQYAGILSNLAHIASEQDDNEKARDMHQEALNLRKKIYRNGQHSEIADSLRSLGSINSILGNNDEAINLHQQAIAMTAATLGKNHPNYAVSLNALGVVYELEGKFNQAAALYSESNAITQPLGVNHPYNQRITTNNDYFNVTKIHNRACILHLGALECSDNSDKHRMLKEADCQFKGAITDLNAGSSTRIEYANFLIQQQRAEEAIPLLREVIKHRRIDGSGLQYNESEKPTVPTELHSMIDESPNKTMQIEPLHFAYFMLIKLNLEKNNLTEAQELYDGFAASLNQNSPDTSTNSATAQKINVGENLLSYCQAYLLTQPPSNSPQQAVQTQINSLSLGSRS